MATIGTVMLLLCLLCGALGQHDANEVKTGEVWSYLLENKDKTLGELVAEVIAKSIQEQASNRRPTYEVPPSLGDDGNADLGDVIKLELADDELVGGCSGGECQFCGKIFKFKVCLYAKLLKLGFELKVTIGDHVIFDKQITVTDPPPLCASIPHIGKACVQVYNVDIENKSACVKVTLEVKVGPFHKHFDIKLKCFHLKQSSKAKPLPLIQVLKALVADRQTDRNALTRGSILPSQLADTYA